MSRCFSNYEEKKAMDQGEGACYDRWSGGLPGQLTT